MTKIEERKEKDRVRSRRYRAEHLTEVRIYQREWARRYRTEHKIYLQGYHKQHQISLRSAWMKLFEERNMTQCIRCGYKTCFAALDFHHRNPINKKYNIGQVLEKKITLIRLAELDKVICLCSNCHRELHAGLWRLE